MAKFKTNNLKSDAGFTLIEILVAIFIFGLVFTATSFILTSNLRSASLVKNNFVASGLVQEGVEVVRNIRDRDWFLGNAFGTSIPDGDFRLQWDSQTLLVLGQDSNLKRDAGTGIFSYDTGTDTIFKRTITISTGVPGIEKVVTVNVTWFERNGAVKTVSAEDHLYNWK